MQKNGDISQKKIVMKGFFCEIVDLRKHRVFSGCVQLCLAKGNNYKNASLAPV